MTHIANRKKERLQLEELKRLSNQTHKTPCGCSGNAITRSVGEIVIVVTRDKFEIAASLPYCIWGNLYISGNNFATVLQSFLPAGVTVVTTITSNSIQFAYTLGAVTDTITVQCPNIALIAYPEILASLSTFYMRSDFATFNCNTGASPIVLTNDQITQLKGGGLFMQRSTGGRNKDTHLIIPESRQQINNSVVNITELYLRNEPIKSETVWIHQFATPLDGGVPPGGAIKFAFCVFISEKIDMNHKL